MYCEVGVHFFAVLSQKCLTNGRFCAGAFAAFGSESAPCNERCHPHLIARRYHMKPETVKHTLFTLISQTCESRQFLKNPKKDFTRNRKLPLQQVFKLILGMGGGTLNHELLDYFAFSPETVTSSAFIQQRAKIMPEAFEHIFHQFARQNDGDKRYRGYRLLAFDGSDLRIPTNSEDADSYFPGTNGQKPYSLLHLNALYDLLQHTYCDAAIQKRREFNERRALTDMVDASPINDALLIADRGLESYNVMAHIQEKGWKFLIRVRDDKIGIVRGLDLPDADEFDFPVQLHLTRKQTNYTKHLFKNRNQYKCIPASAVFDYLPAKQRNVPLSFYSIAFRVARFRLSDDSFETLLTNLDSDEFPSCELKKLYFRRWGIETSFRDLKYTIGLLHFHSKKTEHVLQEVFAALTMYNFSELITRSVVIQKGSKKFVYQANFSDAAYICRQFFRSSMSPPIVEALIARFISPIRPNRQRPRVLTGKSAVSFLYRVA